MPPVIELTENTIDPAAAVNAVRTPSAGAVVSFLGTAREMTGSRRTRSLDYDAYPEMARSKLAQLEDEARRRWPLTGCAVIHRLGHLEIGEVSVAIAVSSAQREPAFEAARWLIDRIKQVVPIWKKENWADGTSQWVHPGMETPIAHDVTTQTGGSGPASGQQGEAAP
jgi:molybdopterin synthase catalytic subunit